MAKMTIDNVTYEGTPEELVSLMKLAEKVTEDIPVFTKGERVKVTGSSVYGRNKDGEIGIFDEICDGYYSVDFGGEELLFETHQVAKVTEDVGPAVETPKYKTEKRAAKAGERILITNAVCTFGDYRNGDVLTVDNRHTGSSIPSVKVTIKNCVHIYDSEYEVIVDDTEESVYPERGDIVRVVNGPIYHRFNIGDIGIVKYAVRSYKPFIEVPGRATGNYAPVEIVARAKDRVDTK